MDTIIAGGTVVTETAVLQAHIGIQNGKISSISSADTSVPSARRVIDGRGLVIVPGSIDAHTHFTGAHHLAKEEVQVGTRGAAAGGVTTIIEMPHSDPPATTLERFLVKREMLTANSVVDFALWGGIDGSRLDQLPLLDRAGAAAMKGFMCSGDPSGRAADERGLPMLDDHAIVGAMRAIKAFDGLIGLHAENHFILHGCMAELKAAGRHDARAHAEAGPELAEFEAVSRAIFFAKETGVRCHIVHLSSAKAAALIRDARKSSRISAETCPQYLILDEDDLDRIGAYARCGPPIRKRDNVEALWSFVFDGEIDSLASDHCPYLPEQKVGGVKSIWNAAMGLTGIQTMSPLFFSEGVNNRCLSLLDFVRMTASGPARLFGMYPRKGTISVGSDADLAFYDPNLEWTVRGEDFYGPAKWTPFEGIKCRGKVVQTLLRGKTVFVDGDTPVDGGYGVFLSRNGRIPP